MANGRFVPALALVPFLTRPPKIVAWQYHEWYHWLIYPHHPRHEGYRDAWTFWEQLCPLWGGRADWLSDATQKVYAAIGLTAALGVFGWCWRQYRQGLRNCKTLSDRSPLPDTACKQAVAHGGPDTACKQAVARRSEECGLTLRESGRLLTLIFSMWAAWQLLFGPATEQFTYSIIAPSASWAVLVSFAEKRARWLTLTAWTLVSLLPAGDIETTVARVFPAATILAPLGAVLFAAWLVWHERDAAPPIATGLEARQSG